MSKSSKAAAERAALASAIKTEMFAAAWREGDETIRRRRLPPEVRQEIERYESQTLSEVRCLIVNCDEERLRGIRAAIDRFFRERSSRDPRPRRRASAPRTEERPDALWETEFARRLKGAGFSNREILQQLGRPVALGQFASQVRTLQRQLKRADRPEIQARTRKLFPPFLAPHQ